MLESFFSLFIIPALFLIVGFSFLLSIVSFGRIDPIRRLVALEISRTLTTIFSD